MHIPTSSAILLSSLLASTAVSAFGQYSHEARGLYARDAFAYPEDDFSLYARSAEPDDDYFLEAREAYLDDLYAIAARDLFERGNVISKIKPKPKPQYDDETQNALDAFGKKDRTKQNDLDSYIEEQRKKAKKEKKKGKRDAAEAFLEELYARGAEAEAYPGSSFSKLKPKPKPQYDDETQNALDAFGKKDRTKQNDLDSYIEEQRKKAKKEKKKGKRAAEAFAEAYFDELETREAEAEAEADDE